MGKLADLNARARGERIDMALDIIVRGLSAPTPTIDVANAVCKALGATSKTERDVVSRAIVKAAPAHPKAYQTGDSFVMYGRTMRRWAWGPKPARIEPAEDWTVGPDETRIFMGVAYDTVEACDAAKLDWIKENG